MSGNLRVCSATICALLVDQASECLDTHTHWHTHTDTHTHTTLKHTGVGGPASSARSTTHTEGGVGLGVARLGVDVALITVQVEIVRAIDCASKCYTSHLSIFFPLPCTDLCVICKDTTVNVNSTTLSTSELTDWMCGRLGGHLADCFWMFHCVLFYDMSQKKNLKM